MQVTITSLLATPHQLLLLIPHSIIMLKIVLLLSGKAFLDACRKEAAYEAVFSSPPAKISIPSKTESTTL